VCTALAAIEERGEGARRIITLATTIVKLFERGSRKELNAGLYDTNIIMETRALGVKVAAEVVTLDATPSDEEMEVDEEEQEILKKRNFGATLSISIQIIYYYDKYKTLGGGKFEKSRKYNIYIIQQHYNMGVSYICISFNYRVYVILL